MLQMLRTFVLQSFKKLNLLIYLLEKLQMPQIQLATRCYQKSGRYHARESNIASKKKALETQANNGRRHRTSEESHARVRD